MNLGDYIGDTRTDSLPAGFLKSIKIKYKHEASHVFPRQREVISRENEAKDSTKEPTDELVDECENIEEDQKASEEKIKPSFMSWHVPSRLLNQRPEKYSASSKKGSRENNKDIKMKRDGNSVTRKLIAPILRSPCSLNNDDEVKNAEGLPKTGKNSATKPLPRNLKQSTVVKVPKAQDTERVSNISRESVKGTYEKENVRILSSSNSKERLSISKKNNRREAKVNKIGNFGSLIRLTRDSPKKDELPKVDLSLQNSKEQNAMQDQEKDKLLPELTTAKQRRSPSTIKLPASPERQDLTVAKQRMPPTATKLPASPERIDKIHTWIDRSTRRERNAAFNVLSTFIQNEKVQMNKTKKDRIMIALNALERKRTPSSLEPLKLNGLTDHLRVIRLDKKDLGKAVFPDPQKAQGLKTWHHLPVYSHGNIHNKSAMFIQPGKGYDRHFSIHPEWGLHAPLAMVPSK